MFKQVRILLLLFVLFIIAMDTWLSKMRSTDWDLPLRVVIYPINGDGSEQSEQYINSLTVESFSPIEGYMRDEAAEYKLALKQPVKMYLAKPLKSRPPTPPAQRDAILSVMWWSLKMRYWAIANNNYSGPSADIKMFVMYYDPDRTKEVAHSLGLEKGLIGVVNAYSHANYRSQNHVVINHEMLHTLGATDKYDLTNLQPIFPQGYADPDKKPLLPQTLSELMAGRTPITSTTSRMPENLDETIIGEVTAVEIGWIKP